MPQVAAAVASAITYVGSASAAVTAGSATLAQTLTVAAVNIATSAALTAASALLGPSVGVGGNPTEWTADPDAPLRYAIGRGGAAGQIVNLDEYGPDNMYLSIVSVIAAGGPIKAFVGYEFDDQPVTFGAGGAATSSQWVGEMWLTTRLGAQPDTALTSPSGLKNGATLPGWTSASKLSGKAAYMLTMAENSKRTAYPNGIPKPLITWEGGYGWDPRLDSTYPGGSGSCRLNDPATWVWIDNPALGALKWATGLWEGPSSGGKYGVPHDSVLVGGFGAKVEGIDVASFVEAANVADANGWTVAAYPSSADNKAQVMDALLQACGAIYAERAGRISCIHRAAPRASVVTISAADTAGPLELDTTVSRIGRINTIRPRYWSEQHRWQMTAADAVTASAYVTEDNGERRTRGVDFPFVRSVQQASELAALQLANTREGFRGVIPLKPHLQRIRPGDAFTITEPGFLLDGQKCLCLETEFDEATGVHRVTFVSETDAKYDFAYGLTAEPPPPATLSPNPGPPNAPDIADWTITPREPPETGGNLPGLDLAGEINNAAAWRVLVEYGLTDEGPWTAAYEGPPTVERLSINVPAGGAYYVSVTYFDRAGVPSARTVFGPYVVEGLSAGLDPDTLADLDDASQRLWVAAMNEAVDRYEAAVRRTEEIQRAETESVARDQAEAQARSAALLAEAQARATALAAEAATRQGQINTVTTSVNTVATNLASEATTRQSQVSALNGAIASVETEVTTLATDLAAETSTRTSQVSALNGAIAAVEAEVETVATDLAAETSTRTTQISAVNTSLATAQSNITTNATAISAVATRTDTLETEVQNPTTGLLARATSLETRTTAVETGKASATDFDLLKADVRDPVTGLLSRATSLETRTTAVETGKAAASRVSTLEAEVQTPETGLLARATSLETRTTAVETGKASASSVSTLTARVGNNEASIASVSAVAADAQGKVNAVVGVTLNVNGKASGFRAANNGVVSSMQFLSDFFALSAEGGNGIEIDGVNGILRIIGTNRRMVLKPSGIVMWVGPSSVSPGSESLENAVLAISETDAFFGGATLTGPFDTGVQSGSVSLTGSYQDIAVIASKRVRNGWYLFWERFTHQGTATPDGEGIGLYAIDYRIVSTNLTGGDVEVLKASSTGQGGPGGSFGPTVFSVNQPLEFATIAGAKTGERRLVLQARLIEGLSASVSNRRLRGFYAT